MEWGSLLRLILKSLGPIREAELSLGDVTLLLGPPNTGKSYALKALYSSVIVLDAHAVDWVVNEVSSAHLQPKIHDRLAAMDEDIRKALSSMLTGVLASAILELEGFTVDENVVARLVERVKPRSSSIEISVEGKRVSFRLGAIRVSWHAGELAGILRDSCRAIASKLIPVDERTYMGLEPVDVFNADGRYLVDVISAREETRVEGLPLLYSMYGLLNLRLEFTLRRRVLPHYELARRVIGAVRLVERYRLSVDRESGNAVASLGIDVVADLPPVMPARGSRAPSADDVGRAVKLSQRVLGDPRLERDLGRAAGSLLAAAASTLARIAGRALVEASAAMLSKQLDVEQVRFIPFGRTLLIAGIERAAAEPWERSSRLHHLVKEFHGLIPASFTGWASIGRSMFLEGIKAGETARLVRAFTPLLEGLLVASRDSRVFYRDWRGATVPLDMASALVGEVTGILFALLSLEDRPALVLIEEPEAQLHPSAQIVMALLLAALPKLCRCKVVASTHSDLLAVTLSYIAALKPSREAVEALVEALTPHIAESYRDETGLLARAVEESARSLNLRIYFFGRDGSVKPVDAARLMREVPGITEVIRKLAGWAAALPPHG